MSKVSYQNFLLKLSVMMLVLIGVFSVKIKNYTTKKLLQINVGNCYSNNKFYIVKTVLRGNTTGILV
jgi:hypothetical protein